MPPQHSLFRLKNCSGSPPQVCNCALATALIKSILYTKFKTVLYLSIWWDYQNSIMMPCVQSKLLLRCHCVILRCKCLANGG